MNNVICAPSSWWVLWNSCFLRSKNSGLTYVNVRKFSGIFTSMRETKLAITLTGSTSWTTGNFSWKWAELHTKIHAQAKFYMHRSNSTCICACKTPYIRALLWLVMIMFKIGRIFALHCVKYKPDRNLITFRNSFIVLRYVGIQGLTFSYRAPLKHTRVTSTIY